MTLQLLKMEFELVDPGKLTAFLFRRQLTLIWEVELGIPGAKTGYL